MTILPLSWTTRVSDLRLMIVYHPFEMGVKPKNQSPQQQQQHTQAKAKGLRGWFIDSLLVVCVCICFLICDFLPDKLHRKALQDGHGQPVSRPAVTCWVWGQQSHCISTTTTGEEEEEIINILLSILRILQSFFLLQLQQMSSSLQQLSASQQQQLLAR